MFPCAIPVQGADHPRVTHPSAASPAEAGFARLACLRRAASVRSEPGSNSPSLIPLTRGQRSYFTLVLSRRSLEHGFLFSSLPLFAELTEACLGFLLFSLFPFAHILKKLPGSGLPDHSASSKLPCQALHALLRSFFSALSAPNVYSAHFIALCKPLFIKFYQYFYIKLLNSFYC